MEYHKDVVSGVKVCYENTNVRGSYFSLEVNSI